MEDSGRIGKFARKWKFCPKNKTPQTRFESKRRLLISPPPSAAQKHSNAEPKTGKWLTRAMHGTNVGVGR